MKRVGMFCSVMAMAVASVTGLARGQFAVPDAPAGGSAGAVAATLPADGKLSNEQLEALVAPVALYPDSVIAQVLMASTYPVEVVQAARWAKANKDAKPEELSTKLAAQTWDESVKALVKVPQVLDMMDQQLDWTTSLGDAFIDDQKAVMDAVQRLRAKANKEGNLKSNEQQVVKVETAPVNQTVIVQGSDTPPPPQVIVIESKNPEVVYVPTYNPAVVYGTWPYPMYPPPPPYYPPGYVATGIISFGVGVAVGAAWNNNWGHCNWGGGDINIDRNTTINRGNNNINTGNINTGNIGSGNRPKQNNTTFQHDPAHRKGAAYKSPATANKYATPQSREAAAARQDFRGKADTGRQQMNSGGAPKSYLSDGNRPAAQPSTPGGGNRPSAQPSTPGGGNRPSAQPSTPGGGNRPSAQPSTPGGNRPSAQPAPSRNNGSAFSGSSGSGSQARQSSSRGQASRSASPSRSGGGSRGGGGGSRGGGGRR